MCLNPILACYRRFIQNNKYKKIELIGNVRKIIKDGHQDEFLDDMCFSKYVNSLIYNQDIFTYILLPCRKCSECIKARSFQWSVRNIIECRHSIDSCFVTLTYDNDNLRFSKKYNIPTLRYKDVSKFIKALRQYFNQEYGIDGIRFYLAGEYGSRTFRPHYHIIFYNIPVKLLKLRSWSFSASKVEIFRSEIIEKLWRYGYSTVQINNDYSIRYCSGYVNKKMIPWYTLEKFRDDNFEPEFNQMSRMPGIGFQDFENYKDMKFENINNDYIIKYGDEVKKIRCLPFFDKKLKLETCEDGYTYDYKIKKNIRPYIEKFNEILSQTDKNLAEYWEQEDELFFNKVKKTRKAL